MSQDPTSQGNQGQGDYVPGQYSNPNQYGASADQSAGSYQQAGSYSAEQNPGGYSQPSVGQDAYQQPGYYQQQGYANPAPGTISADAYQLQPQKTSGLAIASLVLSILGFLGSWFVLGGLFALIGLVLGIIALVKTRKGAGGKGMAIAGVVLSSISLLIAIGMSIIFFMVGAQLIESCGHLANNEVLFERCVEGQTSSLMMENS